MATSNPNAIVKEIMYFKKSDRKNMETLIDFTLKNIKALDVPNVMIAWSSGHTLRYFLEATKNLKMKFNICTVTNPYGGHMGGHLVSIDDKTREELEGKGIKVVYLRDPLDLGEPMAPTAEQTEKRKMLEPWMPFYIDPLAFDIGEDLRQLFSISQGYRVLVGCLILAVRNGHIPVGGRTLCFSGGATGVVMEAGTNIRECYLKEVLGFEWNSDFKFQSKEKLAKMVAITEHKK